MASFDINSIIVLITFVIIFAVFLAFDLFKRNEKYAYLAYIAALLPINFMWLINYDILGVYLLLFILWCATLIRDLWGVKKDKKEINDIILYMALAILIQLIITAILPVSNPALLTNTTPWLVFNLPDIYTETFAIESWVNLNILSAFRLTATLMVILVIIPLILDIKDEEVPFPMFIIIIALFILPFLYLSYIWLPEAAAVLTLFMSVMLFIVLLLITRSGKEESTPLQQKK
ncbi:MAG: hypothetical protein ACTSV5_06950 [Promethearchaeota archaeon]